MAGFQVLYARGFALNGSDEYCATPPQFWRDRALEAARPEADAYFLSCANISAFPVIEEIDRRNCPGRLFDTLGASESAQKALA